MIPTESNKASNDENVIDLANEYLNAYHQCLLPITALVYLYNFVFL